MQMAGSWKKSWDVRSYPDAIARMIKLMPRVYEDASAAGIIGWVGRTYSHQRKDYKSKPPRLSMDKGSRIIFQHDALTPLTYTVEIKDLDGECRVEVEVKFSGSGRDKGNGEQAVLIFYCLTKALEPD